MAWPLGTIRSLPSTVSDRLALENTAFFAVPSLMRRKTRPLLVPRIRSRSRSVGGGVKGVAATMAAR